MIGHRIPRRDIVYTYSGTYILPDIIAPVLPMRKSQSILLSRNLDSVLGPVCNPESAILQFFIVNLRLPSFTFHFLDQPHCSVLN